MQSMNPVFNEKTFAQTPAVRGDAMTVEGATNKSIIAVLLCLAAGIFAFNLNPAMIMPFAIGGSIIGFIMVIAASFKPQWSPVITPLYAVVEGLALGAISLAIGSVGAVEESGFSSLPIQAVLLTFTILFAMLTIYRTGLIKVTERMRMILVGCLFAIFATYMVSFIMGFFGTQIPYIHGSGPIGILFSLAVVGVASFFLLLDFDNIERGARMGAPKYMEWYSALGLLVTLVWLYLEVLKLLAKIQRR